MAELKQPASAAGSLPSSALAASPTGEGLLRIPGIKLGALQAVPDGAPIAERVAPLVKPTDKPGDKVVVVKASMNSAASTLQGRDIDLLANASARLGVELTETTSSSGRRAIILEGNNPAVMGVARMAKAIKEDRAARPFLVGYSAMGPIYQVGPHLIAAPGGLVAVRREGAQIVAMGVIAPTGAVGEIGEFVAASLKANEEITNG